MKATQDTQDHLALVLEELILTSGKEKVREYRHQVRYTNNQFIAFIWGLYHALHQVDKDAIRHNQGNPLLDQHIETALAQALKEYL